MIDASRMSRAGDTDFRSQPARSDKGGRRSTRLVGSLVIDEQIGVFRDVFAECASSR